MSNKNQHQSNTFDAIKIEQLEAALNKERRRVVTLKQRNCLLSQENQRLYVLQQILRLVPEHVYWKDANGVYEGCNEQFAKILGFNSVNEIIGKKEQDINHTNADIIIKNDAEIIKQNKPQIIEELGNNAQVYLSHKSPLHDKNGKASGLVGISINITERKRMEKELEKAKESAEFSNQVKTEMIRNLSHDIRTPLTGMIGQADLIADEYPIVRAEMQELRAAAQRLLALLNTIVDVSQLESGSVIEKFSNFSLSSLVDDVVTCFKPAAKEKKLHLKAYMDGELPAQVWSNYHFIHRIIFNLVGNALKFTEKGNVTVHVEATRKDNQNLLLKVSVKDTGIGIPKDKQAIIFEPFNRLTPSYENRYPGNGLGLYMVSELVRKLGGEIYVDSVVNQGTTFKVLLPVKTALEGAAETKPTDVIPEPIMPITTQQVVEHSVSGSKSQNDTGKQIHVLLVEDDMLAQKTGAIYLNKWGYKVETASNGQQALEKTTKEKFDFIYMDLGLPDLGGDKVTQEIRKDKYNLNQNTPIVALTAHADEAIKKECLTFGMNDVFQKPMEEEATRKIITKYTKELTVIDLAEGARIINADEKMAKEMLGMLAEQLPEQRQAISDAFAKHDYEQLKYHVHKLHGGACYCGVPKLRLAAKTFEHILRANQLENIASNYNQLMTEIQAFMDEWNKIN